MNEIPVPTHDEAEERARLQYKSVLGKTIHVDYVLAYDQDYEIHEFHAPKGNPYRVKVKPTADEDVVRWAEDDVLNAWWEVELVSQPNYPSIPSGFRYPFVDALPGFIVAPGQSKTVSTGSALDEVNRYRRTLGQAPLDPVASGWTERDVELEAQRIAKLNPELRFRQVKQPGGVGVAAYLGRSRVGHVLALWHSTKWLDSGTTEPLFRDHPEYTPKSKVLIVGKSYLAPEVRGQGNGVPLYEALMETAARELGEPYIFASEAAWLGSGTSSEAERVWEALARRHSWYPCRHTSHKDEYYNRRCPPVILVGSTTSQNPRRAALKRSLMR